MSHEPSRSPLSRLWDAAGSLLGIAVMVWIAMHLIQDVWCTLLIVAGVAAVISLVVAVVRRRRW